MSLLPRTKARHAKPSKARPVLAAGGLTAAVAMGDAGLLSGAASAASSDDFARLRMCESGGNYAANTGNGFYGAYQFDRGTWHGQGYSGLPSNASAASQDAAARSLQAERGWQPWPACSRRLGLGSGAAPRASRERAVPARGGAQVVSTGASVAPVVVVATLPSTPPAFHGRDLSVADGQAFRVGVAMWQARMAARGWDLAVDGIFGPQTQRVAFRFAAQKSLTPAQPGTVDKAVWDAAWTLPVS